MNKVIICRGLPASGKTTWSKKQDAVRVNKDDLRMMIDDGKWSSKREKLILQIRDSIIVKGLRDGRDVIVDDTNLSPKHINRISEVVEAQSQIDGVEYEWKVKDFEIDLHEAIKRDLKRERSVGEKVIRDMWNQFIRPTLKVEQDTNLPDAVIFDLDGTLALLNGRNPYDASECEYDLLNHEVYAALVRHKQDGSKIIITSGRSEEYVEQTNKWLTKNGIEIDLFIMRKIGDVRSDSIVKEEMFREHILPKYYVHAVYDDRERVVDKWRDLGLQVFQVADGKF